MSHISRQYLTGAGIMIICTAVLFALNSCGNGGNDDLPPKDSTNVKTVDVNKPNIFPVGDEMFSIPSPVQTAMLIKNSGAEYNHTLLNHPDKYNTYSTKAQKALNLGVYGADLGYVTMYEQTQDGIAYMSSCQKLADAINVSSAFKPALMKRFESNLGNQDSLLILVTEAYRGADAFLKNNDAEDVASLILAGGWVEALHFTCNVQQIGNNPEVQRRIGEQKQSLENLIKLLQRYRNNEEIDELVENLVELYGLFDDVDIKYQYVKESVDPDHKLTVINSSSEVNITEEQLKAIADQAEYIRNLITG